MVVTHLVLILTNVLKGSFNMSKLGEDGKPIYREDGKVLKEKFYEAI